MDSLTPDCPPTRRRDFVAAAEVSTVVVAEEWSGPQRASGWMEDSDQALAPVYCR